jgi:hypothetical protein
MKGSGEISRNYSRNINHPKYNKITIKPGIMPVKTTYQN